MEPRVSVIVPLYNTRAYLPRCLGSLRDQTLSDLEVILVDDGSSDGSLEYALGEFDWGDRAGAVRSLRQENRGPGAARNAALDVARGEYVLFVDSDDYVETSLLERAVGQADRLACDIVVWDVWFHCNVRDVDYHPPVGTLEFPRFASPEEAPLRAFSYADNPSAIFTSFQNWPWNKLFRRSFVECCHLRFPEFFLTEDLPFTCEALVRAERVSVIYERLSHYRTRRESSSMGTKDPRPLDFLEAFLLLRRRLEELGVFERVADSFRAWAVIGVVVNVNGLRTAPAAERVLEELKSHGLRDLGLLDKDPRDFSDRYYSTALELLRDGTLSDYVIWRSHQADWIVDDQRVTIDAWEVRERELLRDVELRDARVRELEEGVASLSERLDDAERRCREVLESRDYRLGERLLRPLRDTRRALHGGDGRRDG